MHRRDFITLFGGAAAAWPLAARAQQPERRRLISVVNVIAATDPDAPPRIAVLETALRDLGWTERDLRIDYYWDANDTDRARAIAKQVVETRPDLIVTVTTPVTEALRDQAGDIPIVFVQLADPLASGIVASLARPGGNVTGFTTVEFSMGSKWLELLKEIAPHITEVGVLFSPATAPGAGRFFFPSIEAAGISFAVNSSLVPVRTAEDIQNMLPIVANNPNAGLIVQPDIFTTNNRDLIIALAARYRLPAVYPFRYFARQGGLISYGTETVDLFRRSASYVDRILKGGKPADLPVQQPTKFELLINLKTAKALGLTVPPSLLATADEVIE